jgi:hypothetical protein
MRYAAIVLFAAMLFGAAGPEQPGDGTAANPQIAFGSPTVAISFEKYEEGIFSVHVQVLSPEDQDVIIDDYETGTIETIDGIQKAPIATLLQRLPDGTYVFHVRVMNMSGLWTEWSDPFYIRKVWAVPEKPHGCKLIW